MNAESNDVSKETATVATITPMHMLQTAIEKGTDLDQLEKLMQLERTWKADQAREAFVEAMNDFRGEAIEVIKTREVSFGSGSNATNYMHADLADVVGAAVPHLSEHGLSHRWETSQDNNQITVACILTHKLGHSESTSLTAGPDTSGAKNSIQAIGSTITYLERYTFMAATGLAAKGMDNDGGQPIDPSELITEKQVVDLIALITEVGADQAAFLEYAQVDRLEDIPAFNYKYAVQMLERKRK